MSTRTHTHTNPDVRRRRMRGPMKNQLTRRIIKNVEKEKRKIEKLNANRKRNKTQLVRAPRSLHSVISRGAHPHLFGCNNIKAAAAQCRASADSDMDSCWPCCNYCCKRQSLWKVSRTELIKCCRLQLRLCPGREGGRKREVMGSGYALEIAAGSRQNLIRWHKHAIYHGKWSTHDLCSLQIWPATNWPRFFGQHIQAGPSRRAEAATATEKTWAMSKLHLPGWQQINKSQNKKLQMVQSNSQDAKHAPWAAKCQMPVRTVCLRSEAKESDLV